MPGGAGCGRFSDRQHPTLVGESRGSSGTWPEFNLQKGRPFRCRTPGLPWTRSVKTVSDPCSLGPRRVGYVCQRAENPGKGSVKSAGFDDRTLFAVSFQGNDVPQPLKGCLVMLAKQLAGATHVTLEDGVENCLMLSRRTFAAQFAGV